MTLVDVQLWNIPNAGYMSPEVIAKCLSAFTNLERFNIGFESPASRPGRRNRSLPPLRRLVLPALTSLEFHGASEYFEDLVARVDTPTISFVKAEFFNQLDFRHSRVFPLYQPHEDAWPFKHAMLSIVDKCASIGLGYRDPPGGRNFRIVLSPPVTGVLPCVDSRAVHLHNAEIG